MCRPTSGTSPLFTLGSHRRQTVDTLRSHRRQTVDRWLRQIGDDSQTAAEHHNIRSGQWPQATVSRDFCRICLL